MHAIETERCMHAIGTEMHAMMQCEHDIGYARMYIYTSAHAHA